MLIAKVIGTIVSTIKHPAYAARKIMLVQALHLTGEKSEDAFVAVDLAQAGIGDVVLVCQEGGSTRQIMGLKDQPVRSSIVGVIDSVNLKA
ncbi:MAG: EutN/CcmL family microcompartment protein [Chloroflexi bacterium]|nr:EutN/CcmL family microcompartment protein [Chloroflexota bacterium]